MRDNEQLAIFAITTPLSILGFVIANFSDFYTSLGAVGLLKNIPIELYEPLGWFLIIFSVVVSIATWFIDDNNSLR